jgi:PIN domain nuclease of toxin-antitoxin system
VKRLLLDTHALIWVVRNDPALAKTAARAYEAADEIYCSVVSFWEIAIKRGKDKEAFPLPDNWLDLLTGEMRLTGMKLLGVELDHCQMIELIPRLHKDPFDRMLIAQAKVAGLAILTKDPKFRKYDVEVVW